MVVLAYHSLEDRMVKERFADWSRTEEPGYVPTGLPASDAQPAHPSAHTPAAVEAVRRGGRSQPAAPRAPVCAQWSGSGHDHDCRTLSPRAPGLAFDVDPRDRSRPAAPRRAHRRRRRARVARPFAIGRLGVLLAIVTVFALVTAVVFHVVLAQNQMELDRLDAQITKEQRVYEKRRLAASVLASPQRVIQEAERLGLVMPPEPAQYL